MAKKETQKTTDIHDTQLLQEMGSLPPQAVEFEEAVLGALLLEKHAFLSVVEILSENSFYEPRYAKIYHAIQLQFKENEPVDILTISHRLRKEGHLDEVGGMHTLTELTGRVASAAHIEAHARIVQQKFIQRELIRVATSIQKQSYDESVDVDTLLNESERDIFEVSQRNMKKDTRKVRDILKDSIETIKAASEKQDGITGNPSGFEKLDTLTSGWQNTDLIIVAARPAMGKTAFVLSMARNMAVNDKIPTAFFSLEMSDTQLVTRLIASESELGEKIKKGLISDEEWKHIMRKIKVLENAPLFIDDTPALSIFELRAKCRRLKAEYDIQMVIIDYLQLMTAGKDMKMNREQEVSSISRSLKAIAKELDVPIIALSQLNRGLMHRENNKPQLSDLRESGAIEQDADMVLFIHRQDYYGLTEDDSGNSLVGMADIIIAKHRNGPTDEIRLRFRQELARFENPEDFSDMPGEAFSEPIPSRMNQGAQEIVQTNQQPYEAGIGFEDDSSYLFDNEP